MNLTAEDWIDDGSADDPIANCVELGCDYAHKQTFVALPCPPFEVF
jgi:hypothetical protein